MEIALSDSACFVAPLEPIVMTLEKNPLPICLQLAEEEEGLTFKAALMEKDTRSDKVSHLNCKF